MAALDGGTLQRCLGLMAELQEKQRDIKRVIKYLQAVKKRDKEECKVKRT